MKNFIFACLALSLWTGQGVGMAPQSSYTFDGNISAFAVSHDGSGLVVGTEQGVVTCVDLETGGREDVPAGEGGRGFVSTLSVEGDFIAAAYADGSVYVFDGTKYTWALFCKHEQAIKKIVIDGGIMATVCSNGIYIWDLRARQAILFVGHERPIAAIALSDSLKKLCVALDNVIYSKDLVRPFAEKYLYGHSGNVRSLAIVGSRLWSAADNGSLRFWDQSGECAGRIDIPKGIQDMLVSDDQSCVFAYKGYALLYGPSMKYLFDKIMLPECAGGQLALGKHIIIAGKGSNVSVIPTNSQFSTQVYTIGKNIVAMTLIDQARSLSASQDKLVPSIWHVGQVSPLRHYQLRVYAADGVQYCWEIPFLTKLTEGMLALPSRRNSLSAVPNAHVRQTRDRSHSLSVSQLPKLLQGKEGIPIWHKPMLKFYDEISGLRLTSRARTEFIGVHKNVEQ